MPPNQPCDLAPKRKALSPEVDAAFTAFSKVAFEPRALPAKTKQIIAVAVAHVTQCPYCIKGHTKATLRVGATPQELMEAVWVASEMRAGAAYAHSALMFAHWEKKRREEASGLRGDDAEDQRRLRSVWVGRWPAGSGRTPMAAWAEPGQGQGRH